MDRFPSDFFYDVDPKANLYKQIVRMCEEVIKGDIDQIHLEETLRRFYMQSGYLLYNLERIFSSIAKFVASIFTGDSRDRSSDIANLFFSNTSVTGRATNCCPEPGEDLGQLDADRAAAEDHQRVGDLGRLDRLVVGPERRAGEARDRRDRRLAAGVDDDAGRPGTPGRRR